MPSNAQHKLRQDFSRAAEDYAAAATLQHTILLRTVPGWLTQLPQEGCILDAGCASGLLPPLLKSSPRLSLFQLDIAEGMCRAAMQHTPKTVCSDIAMLPFAAESFSGIVCSSTLQWLETPESALAELHRVLLPHGSLLLNVFVKGSMPQLSAAFEGTGIAPRILPMPPRDELLAACVSSGFRIHHEAMSTDRVVFPDILGLLSYFRSLGAGLKSPAGPMTRGEVRALDALYPRTDGMLPLDFTTLSLQLDRI